MPKTVLANDGAWGGHGWAVCTEEGPIHVGWTDHKVKGRRWVHLVEFLRTTYAESVEDALLLTGPGDPPPLIATERTHKGRHRSAHVGYRIGQLAGGLGLDSAMRGLPFVELTPDEWRKWWKIGGNTRAQKKQYALDLVELLEWGPYLDRWGSWRPEGAAGDVAEAVLMGVGCARRLEWDEGGIIAGK